VKWNTGKPIPDDATMVGAIPIRAGTSKMFGAIPLGTGTNTKNFGAIQKPGYPGSGQFASGALWVEAGA